MTEGPFDAWPCCGGYVVVDLRRLGKIVSTPLTAGRAYLMAQAKNAAFKKQMREKKTGKTTEQERAVRHKSFKLSPRT